MVGATGEVRLVIILPTLHVLKTTGKLRQMNFLSSRTVF